MEIMKNFKNLALLAVVVAAPSMAAGTNTITFQGTVIPQTCSVQIEGTNNPTITLPKVSVKQLSQASDVAGVTPFKVTVDKCDSVGSTIVNVRLVGAQISSGGRLVNTAAEADKAQNVELQLLEGVSGAPIDLSQAGVAEFPPVVIDDGQVKGEHTFAVRYFATAAATPGLVQSVVNYDTVYE